MCERACLCASVLCVSVRMFVRRCCVRCECACLCASVLCVSVRVCVRRFSVFTAFSAGACGAGDQGVAKSERTEGREGHCGVLRRQLQLTAGARVRVRVRVHVHVREARAVVWTCARAAGLRVPKHAVVIVTRVCGRSCTVR